MRAGHWIVAALACAAPCAAQAAAGSCLLRVDGHTYLDGPCNVAVERDGSFTVGVGETRRARYFAYVTVEPGTQRADASWNGVDAESHAHDPLGVLTRRGGCWSNARATVCAWKPGTRPARF